MPAGKHDLRDLKLPEASAVSEIYHSILQQTVGAPKNF